MGQVVIASRLSDGLVVFLTGAVAAGNAKWVPGLAEAEIAHNEARATELLAIGEADAAEHHTIVDPYLIEVKEEGGQLRPTKTREAIRCFGPTIQRALDRPTTGSEK